MILLFGLVVSLAGCTPALVDSAFRGDTDTVRNLLDKGADVNIKDANGNAALDYAKKYNYDEIIKLLKEAEAKD